MRAHIYATYDTASMTGIRGRTEGGVEKKRPRVLIEDWLPVAKIGAESQRDYTSLFISDSCGALCLDCAFFGLPMHLVQGGSIIPREVRQEAIMAIPGDLST